MSATSTARTPDGDRAASAPTRPAGVTETKASFKTTEFMAYWPPWSAS